MLDFTTIKPGTIIFIKDYAGNEYISIFYKIKNDEIHTYCDSNFNDILFCRELGTNFKNIFLIDECRYATTDEVYELYNKIIDIYKSEYSNWDKYFTESVYYELGDWLAYNCNVEFDDDFGYPNFIYGFRDYAFNELLNELNMSCE